MTTVNTITEMYYDPSENIRTFPEDRLDDSLYQLDLEYEKAMEGDPEDLESMEYEEVNESLTLNFIPPSLKANGYGGDSMFGGTKSTCDARLHCDWDPDGSCICNPPVYIGIVAGDSGHP